MATKFHDIEVNGLTLRYVCWSDDANNARKTKPALLLSHATGFCAMVWRVVAESLTNDYDVYAFDRRGHGQSGKPDPATSGPSGYSLDFYAADTVAALDKLQLREVYAVGHSGGATELLIAAARRPDAIRRVVAIEPIVTPLPEEDTDRTNVMAERASRRRERFISREAVVEAFEKRPPFDSWHTQAFNDYVDYGFSAHADGGLILCCPPRVEAAQFASGGEFPILTVLDKVSAPVLVVNGSTSGPEFESMSILTAKAVLDGRRKTVKGASHFIPMEEPEAVVQSVLGFDT